MTEKETQTTDQRREIILRCSQELYQALRLKKQIEEDVRRGDKISYFTIRDGKDSYSGSLEIGEDLVKIFQGAAFGAYCELAFKPDKQIDKETGEKKRVIDPDGKALADGIVSDMSR